ncbi:GAF domain-containing sensor histidine kinase [Pedobacter sandarakinus]|uniref:GAF domain-containing sensor histidine kinase n=1 Tax=Pedobacter sandarakinus TaxID=353156 RepID=UPI0022487408|nr:GAF domain-containing sensor histidine kinase [Pedobacter sandarakinus]MCX2575877.1 GAF domain-containing sensor histidine kinase [Pedobacter sandarakinus]
MIEIPYPENELKRLHALESYGLMDSGSDPDFDSIALIASTICGIPMALITFIDDKRQYFKSHVGTELTENLRELSFCTHAIASADDIMIVEDARQDLRFANNPVVTGPTNVVFYAGVPLINENGFALGTICVLDQKTHKLNGSQVAALQSLAKQVIDKIELKKKVATLELANRELLNANTLIQKFASMAAHDIKNPLSSVSLTSQLIRKIAINNSDERLAKLADLNISSAKSLLSLVDEMLDYSKSPERLFARKQRINVAALFERINNLTNIPDSVKVDYSTSLSEIVFPSIAVEQIMLNLLSNAIRYNDKEYGQISISLSHDVDHYILKVADNGMGIAEEHHELIFHPDTTLANQDRFGAKSTGIGLSTVKNLVNALNGSIYLESVLGAGTTFTINLRKMIERED